MKLRTLVAWAVAVTVLAVGTLSAAQAQTVRFADINDAVPSRFFDVATSAPDRLNPNKLIIGFNTGLDPRTWKVNTFTASTAAFYYASAADTISFRVEAPPGFYVAWITYTQRGTGSIARIGTAAGSTNWVVNDTAADLGLFGVNPTLSRTADLTGQHLTQVSVSITTSLFTFAPAGLGSATISVTSADVLVELLPCPGDDQDCSEG